MDLRKSDIRALQEGLAKRGLYKDTIDGRVGSATLSACRVFLSVNEKQLHDDYKDEYKQWPNTRTYAAAFQLILLEEGHNPGPIDGYYGSLTRNAADWFIRENLGISAVNFELLDPKDLNPNGWPKETTAALNSYFGTVNPPHSCPVEIEKVPCPWTMGLDWDMSKKRNHFNVHKKVAASLIRVLKAVYEHYGDEGIKKHGLNRFSGDFTCRKIRGGNRPSTHAWGIAIDFYGSRNELKRTTNDTPPPTLAHPELSFFWERWEEEGWYSLGRMEDRDWMHIQAAKGKRSKYYHN